MNELVTGDAVVLGLRPARLPSRACAVLIDLLLVWSLYVALSLLLLSTVSSLDLAAVAAVQVALFLLVPVGLPIAVETLSRGRSVGKLVFGLRVVREDGGPVRFRHALTRGAVGVVEILLTSGVVACVASLVSERGRRLGDVFAGTLVVRERVPSVRSEQAPPPPVRLEGRFAGLDLSGVPEGLWLAVRQYLMRAGQLDQAVSRGMAERLTADLAACTGAPPPADVPPPHYLAGVLAERQARDARRAFGPAGAGAARGTAPRYVGAPAAGAAPSAAPSLGQRWTPPGGDAPRGGCGAGARSAAARRSQDRAVDGGTSPGPGTGFVPPA
ncbi:RDD family protein [Streptomyces sp. RKND-216]|uniref:RDD family protein n=1 Tax=Streptomyces sp. RKND-216 TaxID=2562581 RepID=UPI00109DC19B|nr:RDD family protein [Streptomyces sp. RKND-216]THA26117.1 RDD family protein [Streptomyces sp. RKND-216]